MNNSQTRRPNMDFHQMGIPNGSILKFRGTNITVQVISSRKVRFMGEDMSLTRATKNILKIEHAPATRYNWSYKDRPLNDIYNQTY